MSDRTVQSSSVGLRVLRASRRAFTLIELIVVVTLLVVVLGIAVPAFNGMINASERSLAENTLRVGVTVARDLAVLNGEDSGLLFVREPNGRTRLIPVVKVGTLDDSIASPFLGGFVPGDAQAGFTVERDVFAPVDFASSLQLPRGWTVAGYAEAGSIDRPVGPAAFALTDGWYDSVAYGDNGQIAGAPDPVRDAGHWLLPESGYYEQFSQGHGSGVVPDGFTAAVMGEDAERTPRQSFMLRFESGSGLLLRGGRPALVLDPRPTSLGRLAVAGNRWTRANRIENAVDWTDRVLRTRDIDGLPGYNPIGDETYRLALVGNYSNDTVLAGSVSRLAIFEDEDLAAGIGASGLNEETNSLYAPIEENGFIAFDEALLTDAAQTLYSGGAATVQQGIALAITRWIQGDTNFLELGTFDSDGDGDPGQSVYGDAESQNAAADEPLARIYFIHPGTGDLTEVAR